MPVLEIIQLAATLYMTGLIWFVQIVHYPLMEAVGADGFREYSRRHQQLTTRVVAGPMLLEAVSAALIVAQSPHVLAAPTGAVAFALLVVLWLSTAFWQVPLHGRLLHGYDVDVIRRLVRSNWLRTVAWTVRAVLLSVSWGQG